MNEHVTFGAWSSEELKSTLLRGLNEPLLDEGVADIEALFVNVVHVLRKSSLMNNGLSENERAVFFLSPTAPEEIKKNYPVKQERFLHTGKAKLCSKVWFVSSSVQRGGFLDFEPSEFDNELNALLETELAKIPAAFFDPSPEGGTIYLYRNGLDENYSDCVSLPSLLVSSESIKSLLDDVYEGTLKTPSCASEAGAKIWNDSSKWHPAESVEKVIQGRLKSCFYRAFSMNLFALSEISTAEGRLDLLLQSHGNALGTLHNHALLELKALTSFSHTGKTPYGDSTNLEAISKGVLQATVYKDVHRPLHTMLCCFDMSKDEHDDDYWFSATQKEAEEKGIFQWRWRLYNSADSFRSSVYGSLKDN
ncbi:hypothetical protein [Stutzerimonas nitrititolerans]|uniref:hypothetical protein n=1 Tax=Stutzerimonas nitrititolerans TaxID=2482751 RepID=UPI002898367B|nr:hypothetical protein [Stutzerimonas nitrititolerans]